MAYLKLDDGVSELILEKEDVVDVDESELIVLLTEVSLVEASAVEVEDVKSLVESEVVL